MKPSLAIIRTIAFSALVHHATVVHAEQPREDDVSTAIEELDSDSFSDRERAARALWSFGAAAEPALREVVASNNLEARQRAAQILAEFDFGITPDLPAHIAKLFRQYRTGSTETRLQVFSTLIESGEFTAVQSLLKRATDRRTRHAVYTQSIQSTPIMVGMIHRGELDEWIAVMSADEFSAPRHEVVANWLTAKDVLHSLAAQDDLSIVELAIAQEPSDNHRNLLLRRLFVQREFTDFYAAPDRLEMMLHYIDMLPGNDERHELFVRFLSLARNASLYERESLGRLIRFASTRGTARTLHELWTYTIDTILRRPEVESQMTPARLQIFASQLDPENVARLKISLQTNSPGLAAMLEANLD